MGGHHFSGRGRYDMRFIGKDDLTLLLSVCMPTLWHFQMYAYFYRATMLAFRHSTHSITDFTSPPIGIRNVDASSIHIAS